MKHLYGIKDTAIQAFGSLHNMHSQGEMLRSLQDEVNRKDEQSAIAKHPSDYELYKLGEYDQQTGIITPQTGGPLLVARCKDLQIIE